MAGYDNISSNISLIVLIDSHAYKYGVHGTVLRASCIHKSSLLDSIHTTDFRNTCVSSVKMTCPMP